MVQTLGRTEAGGGWVRSAPAWARGGGALILLARFLYGFLQLRRWTAAAVAAGRIVRIPGSRVRVVFSDLARGPSVVGLFRPTVVLPAEARGWPAADRRAVLAHELAHVRRGDAWWNVLMAAAVALYWPNPLAWLTARLTRRSAEAAADASAVGRGTPSTEYASLLVELSGKMRRNHPQGISLGGRGSLGARVAMVLAGTKCPRRWHSAAIGVALTCAAVVLAGAGLGPDRALVARLAGHFSVGHEVAAAVL